MAFDLNSAQELSQSVSFDLNSASPVNDEPKKKRTVGDIIADVGITGLKGAVGLPQSFVGLVDIPTGGRVGKALDNIGIRFGDAQQILDSGYSDAQQEANRKVHEAEGFTATLKAAIDNPSVIATTVGESIPQMLGGMGVAKVAMKAAPKVAPWLAGAVGEGVIGAGGAAESIREQSDDGLLTAKQSLSAVGSGAGTSAFGALGGKLAQKFKFADVDTMLAQGGANAVAAGAAKKGFIRQVVESGISEGAFEELPQSMQEQMWQNFATDKPLTDGVGNAGALGLLAGGLMGGAGGGYNAIAGRQPETMQPKLNAPLENAENAGIAPQSVPTGAVSAAEILGMPEQVDQAAPTLTRAATIAKAGILSQGKTGFGAISEFGDFAAQERTDLEAQRAAMLQEQQAANSLRLSSELETTDARVAGAAEAEARQSRLAALDSIYFNPDERTPGMSFLAHLEASYPNSPIPTPEEKRIIAQREQAYQAFSNMPEEKSVDFGIPEKAARTATERSDAQKFAQVDAYLANGYKPSAGGKRLVNGKGKMLFLNSAQQKYIKDLPPVLGITPLAQPTGTAAATSSPVQNVAPPIIEQAIQESVQADQLPEVQNVSTTTDAGTTGLDTAGRADGAGSAIPAAGRPDELPASTSTAMGGTGQGESVLGGVRTDAVAVQPETQSNKASKQESSDKSARTGPAGVQPAQSAETPQKVDLESQIKPIVEQLIKLRKNAGQVRLAPQLDIAVNKAKSAIKSGTGKAADFTKLAKVFKSKDAEIHAAILSIANALEPVKADTKKPQKASSDLLQRIKQLGGIDGTLAQDITGEPRGVGGWKFAFKKGGTGLDDLATMLASDGFMIDTGDVDGGVQQLRDMIRAHIGGERNFKAQTLESQAEQDAQNKNLDALVQRAEELGIKWRNLDAQQLSDAVYEAEDALEMERLDAELALDDAEREAFAELAADETITDDEFDIPFGDNARVDQSAMDAYFNFGANNEKNNDGQADGATGTEQAQGSERGAPTGATSQADQGQVLQSYTAAEIAKREAAQREAEQRQRDEEAKAKKAQAEKDQSDIDARTAARSANPDNFQFGENSKQAAAPVGDLFSQPAQPSAEIKPAEAGNVKPFSEVRAYLSSNVFGKEKGDDVPDARFAVGTLPAETIAEIGKFIDGFSDKFALVRISSRTLKHTDEQRHAELDAVIDSLPKIIEGKAEVLHNPTRENSAFIVYESDKNYLVVLEVAKNGNGTDVVNIITTRDRGLKQYRKKSAEWLDGRRSHHPVSPETPAEGEVSVFQPSGENNIPQQAEQGKQSAKAAINASDLDNAAKLKAIEALNTGALSPEDVQGVVGAKQFQPAQAEQPAIGGYELQQLGATSGEWKTVQKYKTQEEAKAALPKGSGWRITKADQTARDRDHFTLERLNRDTDQMEPVTFERGEYVRYLLSGKSEAFGEIDGISNARREFSVDGLWYPFGAAYKAEKPVEAVKPTVPLSSVIEAANAKHGGDLNYADRIHTLAVHDDVIRRVMGGQITADEFKASFDGLENNKAGIIASLESMTKPQIFKRSPGLEYRYKNEKKDRVVEAAYRGMLDDFVLGDSISYSMGRKYEDVILGYVEQTTDETLAEYADQIKRSKAERETRAAENAAGMDNPQTLDDFKRLMSAKAAEIGDGATFKQAFMALTPDQRAQYDALAAEYNRGERKSYADKQKTDVRVAAHTTTGDVIETKHTKTGEPLFVVKAAERVERDVYTHWNNTAKRLGGWYSSYRGGGAVPGFQFKTRENADAFLSFIGGNVEQAKEAVQARRDAYADDRSQSAVERLTEMASALDEKADDILGADRKMNTARRARFAASAEASGNHDKAMAQTMRNIAQAIENGTAKMLDQVRQKVQVEMLQGMVTTAQNDMQREKYPTYAEQERHKGEKPTQEVADYATFPVYTAYRSDLAGLGRALLETDGTKKLGQRLMKVADDVTDAYLTFAKENLHKVSTFKTNGGGAAVFTSKADAEAAIARSGYRGKAIVLPFKRGQNLIVLSPSEAMKNGIWQGDHDKRITLSPDFGVELVEALGRLKNRGRMDVANAFTRIPWQFENAYDKRKRLATMGIETPSELRAALREFIGLRQAVAAPDKVKELERAMIGRKNDGLDFFPTPAAVADEMIEAAGIEEGMSVLEPSAGMGHIAERIRAAGVEPEVVEIASDRRELLEAKGFNVIERDFMDIDPRGFTYGDTFRAPDGKDGIMRGLGGMGSGRVRLVDDNGDALGYYDRDELTEVRKNGSSSGYDRILMNPPFGDRRDALHVQHAYDLLKPGGRLVAIMGEGVFFGNDKKAQDFRAWLESVGGTDEKLEQGTFMDASLPVNTGVSARMVVIDKAEGDAPLASRANSAKSVTAQTEPLSRKEFDKLYVAQHKDIASKDKEATKQSIIENGLRRGFNVNAVSVYRGGEPQTIIEKKFGNRAGNRIYLLRKEGVKNGPNGYTTVEGYKPAPEDVIDIKDDWESSYDAYLRNFENPDIRASRSARTTGQTIAAVKQATQSLRNRWLGFRKIEIVQHDSELPQEFRDRVLRSGGELASEGWFDPKTKTVYLVADNLATPERAVWVAAHEVAGHGGVRMLDSSIAEALDFAGKNGFVKKLAQEIAADRGETFNAKAHTDEALAELAAATITDNVDAIMDRYGVKVPVGMRSNLVGMVKRVVDAVRKFIAQAMGKKVDAVSDAEVYGLLRQMREAVEGKEDQAAQADGGYAPASRAKVEGERFARLVVEEFVAENDVAFRHPVSSAKSLEGVMRDVMPDAEYHGEHTRADERDETGADHRFVFTSGYGKQFYVYTTDSGKVWIDVSRFVPNERGQAVYAAVANYAYNTNKKFVGDPVGVSRDAVIRRTNNMLSSALRFGTTRHLEASKEQIKGDVDNGIEPLDWTGNDVDKVEALIHTSITTTQNLFPGVKNVTYDFTKRKFIGRNGLPIHRGDIERRVREGSGRASGAGEATIRRIAFLQSLVSSKGSERSGILEQALNWLNQANAAEADLDGLFSKAPNSTGSKSPVEPLASRAPAQTSTTATQQPPGQPPRQGSIPLQGGQAGNPASWDAPEASKLDSIIYTLQDKHIDMKRVVEAIKEAGGNLVEKFNPYLAEELFHGRAAKRTQDFVNTELKPLIADMRMRGLDIDALDKYLHSRHAKEANDLIAQRDQNMPDGGSGMTNQEVDDYFASLPADKQARLEAAAKRVDDIIAKTRDLYVFYGLVAKDQADSWAQMFQHYVPLMREDNDGGMGIGQGFSIKGKEVKHRTGSTAKVVDILANIALQREKAITRGEKNRVAVALAGLVKLNPNPEFWTFGNPPIERVLNEKTGLVEERIDLTFKSKPNVVVAKIKDGSGQVQERAVIFDERDERAVRMVEAFKNLDAVQLGGVMGVSAMITRYFSSINTQYNPIFGIVNIVRDVQGMALNLGSTPIAQHRADVIKLIPSAIKGIYLDSRAERDGHPASSTWAQMWEELQDEGGMTGYRDLYRNSEDRADSIKHELDPYRWHNNALGKVFTANGALKVPLKIAQNRAGWLFDWLSDYNQTLEGATRLATYKVARDNGMTKQQAASLAKNITVNFNRKGYVGQQAGAMYAFFNAAMQGSARIAQTMLTLENGKIGLTKTGKAIVYGGITLGALQALMLAAAGFDDDEPPEFVRERALIIPIGGKKYLTLPMPLGFHVFPNIGRIPTEWALNGFKDTPERIIHLLGTTIEAFNPLGSAGMSLQTIMPTALDPFTALAENKDWTGKPIYKEDFNSMKPTPGFERNKDTATAWSKGIAEALNYMSGGTDYVPGAISPTADQIDYLISQVTGGVGRELSKAAQAGGSVLTGEELPPHKMPLVGRFYGDSGAQSSQGNAYYSNLKRINEVEAEIKGRRENREPIDEYKQDNPEWKLIGRAKVADKIISNLRKQKRELIEKDAPREKIKAIEDKITAEMQRLNEVVRKLEEKEAA